MGCWPSMAGTLSPSMKAILKVNYGSLELLTGTSTQNMRYFD